MFKKLSSILRAASSAGMPGSDAIFAFLVGLFVIAGPLFIIPIGGFTVAAAKTIFVAAIAMVMVLVAAMSALKNGRVVVPHHPVFLVWIGLCVVGFIGSVLSGAFHFSLVGYLFEPSTWAFLAELGVIGWYSYRAMRTPGRLIAVYGGMVVAFLIAAILAVIRFAVGGAFANLGVLWTTTSTLVGTWSDFAVLAAMIAIIAVVTLEVAPTKKVFKWLVGVIGAFALVILVFMNIRSIWAVVGLVGLAIALYLFSLGNWDPETKQYHHGRRVPWFSLSLAVIAILGMFLGNFANTWASHHQPIVWNEVRPNMTVTARTGIAAILHNPVTGYGPNGFNAAWSHAKPPALSAGNATNYDFGYGYGYVPTQMAATGILGIIAWIAWFVMIGISLVRGLMRPFDSGADRYGVLLNAALILFTGLIMWTTNVGTYALVMMMVLVGIMLARTHAPRAVSFIRDPRTSFFGIIGILAVTAVMVWGLYTLAQSTISVAMYHRGMDMVQAGNPNGVDVIARASMKSGIDEMHHQAANLILASAANLIKNNSTTDKANLSKQVEQLVGTALGHAQAAIDYNKNNYANWVFLGDVYRTMAGWGIEGSVDRAQTAYDEAVKRNPADASLLLSYAGLAVTSGNTTKALDWIEQSINRYPTRNAYLMHAQILWGMAKYDEALAAVLAAVGADPRNPDLSYEYGQLLFARAKYATAIQAFLRTIMLAPQYGPAYGYLGVSYERSGDMENANRVYDYMRKQSAGDADRLIAQIKSQTTVAAPAPIDATKTDGTDVKKPVAPNKKKQ